MPSDGELRDVVGTVTTVDIAVSCLTHLPSTNSVVPASSIPDADFVRVTRP